LIIDFSLGSSFRSPTSNHYSSSILAALITHGLILTNGRRENQING
jgi:hypothetical protein